MKPAPPFNPVRVAKGLLRTSRSGALATLMAGSGAPYCSLVNVMSAADGSPLLLLSDLALHTRNIAADPRISLMLDERRPGDALEGARIMLAGHAETVAGAGIRRRYLAAHPGAAQFVDFADFHFVRMMPSQLHLVAGFGRIVDLAPGDFLTRIDDADALLSAEADIVTHLNADHSDTLALYATALAGAAPGNWHCVACDPEGIDLQCEAFALRIDFSERATSPAAVRKNLKILADRARVGG